ncbi:hypothetical protein [Micromonospora endolithica]|uniref:Uncharacterized protein n=1 Tax=Micromonospora endolithica TaxID=230091 RepID=A0A3A9ZAF9_9ACTN|nr:hypothetical protein [Micromonospora endolithica]RKN44306.1 hypothetical protein D7223_18745 [Micromonospora endolithica]TWJ25783.1 hypothetical protein JD76_05957 [Micromonospora endolithica]
MLSPRRALRAAAARLLPRRPYWLGTPLRATIAAVTSGGGYVLLITYSQGTEWVDLPARTEPYDRPDDREFTAVAAALAARGLARTEAWAIDTNARLCASINPVRKEARRG